MKSNQLEFNHFSITKWEDCFWLWNRCKGVVPWRQMGWGSQTNCMWPRGTKCYKNVRNLRVNLCHKRATWEVGNHHTKGIARITNTKFHCSINLRIKLRNQLTNLPCPWLALKHLKGSCVPTLPPKLTVSIFGSHITRGWKWGDLIGSHSFPFIWYCRHFVPSFFFCLFSLPVLTRILFSVTLVSVCVCIRTCM